MPKWFILGVFLAAVSVFVPMLAVRAYVTSGPGTNDSGFLITIVPLSVFAVWFVVHGLLGHLSRPQRPHTLFTPLYDQR